MPISHYNLGALYRLTGKTDEPYANFGRRPNSILHSPPPISSSSTLLRTSGAQDEAKPEFEIFQRLKKQQEGAAIPEDVEWNMYAEVYDVMADSAGRRTKSPN